MKLIKYTMFVKDEGDHDSKKWSETDEYYVENGITSEFHAQSIVSYFNRTLRPDEKRRELVSVISL